MKATSYSSFSHLVPHMSLLKKGVFLPIAAILLAVVFWGGSFAAMRVAVSALNPWTVMWFRMTIAALLILPFISKLKPKHYQQGDWKLLIPTVAFQPCLYFLLESYALKYTTSTQAGVIVAVLPLMVASGAWLILGESIHARTVVGLMISIVGVICLTLMGTGSEAANPVLGNFFEFLAMASASANMVLIKKLSERYNSWTLTAMQVFTGAIFFLPGLLILIQSDSFAFSWNLIAVLLFLGSIVTLGAFGLYNWGISQIPASKASAFINLVPVFAVLFGWFLLNEKLSLQQSLAACCVIVGVWISQRRKAK